MALFDVVVVEVPTQKERKNGKLEKIVVPTQTVAARDEDHAKTKSLLAAKDLEGVDLDKLEAQARPFGE